MPPGASRAAFGIFIGLRPESFVLRFDAFSRPYIEERQWHPSQKLEVQPDGGVVLSFECAPSYEVTNWVASWREHVEVLEWFKAGKPTRSDQLRGSVGTHGATRLE